MNTRFRSSRRRGVAAAPAIRHFAELTDFDAKNRRPARRELARRFDDSFEVTLVWDRASGDVKVCVCDHEKGAYFEIRAEHHLALDVYYHPYWYLSFADVYYQDDRLAAVQTEAPRAA